MKRYIKSNEDSWDEYSPTQGYKYWVCGGPVGDYVGDYNEDLADYFGKAPFKDVRTNDPEDAIFAWFKAESMHHMDAAIYTDKDQYAQELCQWVVDHEDTFEKMYNRVDCGYKYEYLLDGAKKYANKSQIGQYTDQIFPFCYG